MKDREKCPVCKRSYYNELSGSYEHYPEWVYAAWPIWTILAVLIFVLASE